MKLPWHSFQRALALILAVAAVAGTTYWWTGPITMSSVANDVMHSRLRARGVDEVQINEISRLRFFSVNTFLLKQYFPNVSTVGEAGKVDNPRSLERWFLRLLGCCSLLAAALALAAIASSKTGAAGRSLGTGLACLAFSCMWLLVATQDNQRALWFVLHFNQGFLMSAIDVTCWGGCLVMSIRFFQSFPREIAPVELDNSVPNWLRNGLGFVAGRGPNWSALAMWTPVVFASSFFFLYLGLRMRMGTHSLGALALRDYSGLFCVIILFSGTIILMVAAPLFSWLYLRAGRLNCAPEEKRKTDWLYATLLVGVSVVAVALLVQLILTVGVALQQKILLGQLGAMFFFGVILFLCLKYKGFRLLRTVAGISAACLLFGFYFGSIVTSKALPAELLLGGRWLAWVGLPAFVFISLVGLGFSVFFRGAFEPSLVVRKTALIATVAVLMCAVTVVLEYFAVSSVLRGLGSSVVHGANTMMAGAIVTLGLHPLRHRLHSGISLLTERMMPATVIAEGKRRDMAVMFSDLGGYTALSAKDETQALHVAGQFQKTAAEVARRHGGRIVKTIGDAVMWVFTTPAEAFAAALELSADFQQAAKTAALSPLPVNSGVHFGSLVEAPGGDVYGATVNLAARLQSVAKDEAVVASAEAMMEVSGGFRFEPMGKLELKNVPVPIACFRVLAAPA